MASWQAPPQFEEYVRDRHAVLLRFAYVLSGDAFLAADLVQDALEQAGRGWLRIQRQDDPESYLRRTIVNRYLNRRRALRRETLMAQPPEPGLAGAADAGPMPVDSQLWRLLAGLPRQQRAVLVLRFYQDLSEAQIADVLGCAVGTVKSNASRAMTKLRAAISGQPAGTPTSQSAEAMREGTP
jgi:RNA polymerase sigma-70 factor (sigma-E family)